jgi:hypothetical protein
MYLNEHASEVMRRCASSGHSKGDAVCYSCSQSVLAHHLQYIMTYTQRRSRDRPGADIVQDIDNVRNGLFLNQLTHVVLGKDMNEVSEESTLLRAIYGSLR